MSVTFVVNNELKITNQKIVDFYKLNMHINFESVNLSIIEILNNVNTRDIDHIKTAIMYPNEQKITELESFLTNMREAFRKLIQLFSSKYIIAKSEYIREFKSSSVETDKRELLSKTNQSFFETTCSILSVLIRTRFSNVAEKVKVILHQFNKIMTVNTEQIFSKTDASSKIDEYLTNFELNSSHMIQAIIQLLTDCLASYESRAKQVTESIKKNDDPTFAVYYKLIYELNDVVHQLPSSTEYSNDIASFEHLLSQTFTTASISIESESNEYLLMREDKPIIYIETHDFRDKNVGTSDVKQFLKRAIDKNANSILISQYTGITSKPNYHIEIHNNIVVIYLHKLSYSSETLQIAADMIDSISSKLSEFCSLSDNKYSIPKDVLDGVNREYQRFIMQKESIITGFKEQQKSILSQLEDMRFGSLDKYLSTRYSSCKKQGYNCDMCNNFNVGTLKGLAAHKRGCARKIASSSSSSGNLEKLVVKVVDESVEKNEDKQFFANVHSVFSE
jgi:hypothetical protein